MPKGFVFLSSGSAPVRLHFDDHYYVYRCLSYTGKLEQESDCSDYGPGQYLSMNRVEPLEPGIYLLKKDPTARDYFFTVKSGQKTDIPISLVTIGQLLKLHKNLKHYLPLSTNYDIKVIVDYRSPTQRLSEELLARAAIKNRLAGKFETRCGQNIGVADALQRGEFEICVGQTRKTLRLLADKEAQRILSMYEMNPAEGFYIHDYLPTGEIRRNKLDFNWVDIDGRNATSLESIVGGLFKGIAGEGAGYEYIYNLEEHDVTQVALVPGDYVILVTNNSKETVDSFPLKVTGKK
ncbi:MAG: hypothetical protein EOP04_24065 [Proteobacteria bacterium]|nr:MAG: hypothetical protein EOP04_24065 [Pseudomonadota bacterium]